MATVSDGGGECLGPGVTRLIHRTLWSRSRGLSGSVSAPATSRPAAWVSPFLAKWRRSWLPWRLVSWAGDSRRPVPGRGVRSYWLPKRGGGGGGRGGAGGGAGGGGGGG